MITHHVGHLKQQTDTRCCDITTHTIDTVLMWGYAVWYGHIDSVL
jgi:hypothetical protein